MICQELMSANRKCVSFQFFHCIESKMAEFLEDQCILTNKLLE